MVDEKEIDKTVAKEQKVKIVEIDYTNWKGERRWRCILPHILSYGNTDYHPEHQWFVCAWDIEDGNRYKYFPLASIHAWRKLSWTTSTKST